MSQKIKLQLPQISPQYNIINNPLQAFFNLINIIAILILPFITIAEIKTIQDLLPTWISIITIIFTLRIIAIMFFGLKVFPSVKFDLSILTSITLFLICTIIQNANQEYTNLGGTNIWGIGVLLLSAISIYLIFLSLHNKQTLSLFINSIFLCLGIVFFNYNISNDNFKSLITAIYNNAFVVMGIIFLPMSFFYFLKTKSKLSKTISLFTFINAIALIIFSKNYMILLILSFSILPLALILIYIQEKKNSKLSLELLKNDINKYKQNQIDLKTLGFKHIGIFLLFIFYFFMIILTLVLSLVPEFNSQVAQIFNSYNNAIKNIDEIKDFIFGTNLVSYGVSFKNLIISYGLLGITSILLIKRSVLKSSINIIKFYYKQNFKINFMLSISIVFAYSFLLIAFFFIDLNLIFILIISLIITIIFSLESNINKYSKIQKKHLSLKPIKFKSISKIKQINQIMPFNIWIEIFETMRVLLTITIIIYLPQIIDYIQKLL